MDTRDSVIAALLRAIAAPEKPSESLALEYWNDIESGFNLIFPEDYKVLLSTYGSGKFFDFISFFIPGSKNRHLNLLEQVGKRLSIYKFLKAGGEVIPYELYPSVGGLFPIAGTDNGDTIFLISKAPGEWRVVINESRGDEWADFDLTISDFLCGLLDGSVVCKIFPKLSFEPHLFVTL